MRINMGDTITLDDNEEYLIVTKSFINEKEYYFLINEKSYQILFCYLENDEMVEVSDEEELENVMDVFLEDIQKFFNSENENKA